jgi:hypothetical protein
MTRKVVSGIYSDKNWRYPQISMFTATGGIYSDKNWRYPQIPMFTATGVPTGLPLVVLG